MNIKIGVITTLSVSANLVCLGSAFFNAAHTSKVIDLLRSDVRGQFETEEHLHTHVKSTLDRLFDETHEDHLKQNNFIITTSDEYNIEYLKELFGAERFDIVDTRHFHVSVPPSQLKSLMSSTRAEGSIVGVVPVVPAMKIDSLLHDVRQECDKDREDRDLYVGLAALSSTQLDSFTLWLDAVALNKDLPFSYQREDAVPQQQRFVKFTSACSDTIKLAQKLVENPEVIWIEEFRSQYIYFVFA
jgi:hypothetical protein